jgi:alpha-beta hydrolase superfamily lysophospholipase
MGGTVVLRTLLENPERFREAIVCGPALNPGRSISPVRRLAIRILSITLPNVTLDHGYRASQMSTDPEVVAEYKDDPLVHRRISLGLAGSISRQSKQIRQAAERFDAGISLLLLQGGLDTVAHPEDARRFGERVACEKKQIHVFPGMKHEVFNETETENTFRAMDAFLGLPIG